MGEQLSRTGLAGVGILLAAGQSARMGQDKRWLDVKGVPMALRVAQAMSGAPLKRHLAIIRTDDETLAAQLAALGFETLANPHPERGRASSVACALGALAEAGPVMMTLADLPELTAERVGSLWRRFCEDGAQDILIPRHQEQAGHPRCFGKAHVAALIAQGDAVDVPAYLAAHSQSVRFWDVDDPAVTRDIDTPAAYAALCRRLAHDA
ncbi:MAG: nucleotidyltransferase family protein [Candidatus Macondimonas sp.]